MPELDDAVLDEAASRGERLLAGEFVKLLERAHDGRGVPRGLVDDYLDELADDAAVDAAALRGELEDRLTDADSFADADAVYEVGDGRVSTYPGEWHDRLGADASLAAFVDVMSESMEDPPNSAASPGVAKEDVLDAAVVLGGMDRSTARERVNDLRADGVLVADADQHPRAGVALAEDVDFEKEVFDKPDWGDRSAEQ